MLAATLNLQSLMSNQQLSLLINILILMLTGLKLTNISQDVEDVLVKTLDVPLMGKTECGFEKVGKALEIDDLSLQYLKNNKERSPTWQLLEILKAKYPHFTVADLLHPLKN